MTTQPPLRLINIAQLGGRRGVAKSQWASVKRARSQEAFTRARGAQAHDQLEEGSVDTTTLLIIIVILLVVGGGGGWYGRGRWY